MPNERPAPAPWPGWPRLVYSVTGLAAADSVTLLFLWLRPDAAAAAEASLGADPTLTLCALTPVLIVGWGLLASLLPQPAAELISRRRWWIAGAIILSSSAASYLALNAAPPGLGAP